MLGASEPPLASKFGGFPRDLIQRGGISLGFPLQTYATYALKGQSQRIFALFLQFTQILRAPG